jgi:hypothetical protein
MQNLHDWTLISINFEWRAGRVVVELEDSAFVRRTLVAESVSLLDVPQDKPWGPSVSVNEVVEAQAESGSGRCLKIEMQSGDVIRIDARSFIYPL